jgi:RND family efflux transporter MFP subunit
MVKEATAGVTKAEADVARWKAELAQVDDLVARRVVDAQNREVTAKQFKAAEAGKAEADARVLTATATVAERKAKRLRADADVLAAAARVGVTEAEVGRLKELVAYTEVKAPFDGVVTARNVHPGRLLQAGSELFTVARLDVVRVFVDVPEVSAGSLTTGAKATVRIPALANREFAADVTRSTGVIQPDTRALRVEIDLENKDRALRPGMYAFVQIKAESAEATMLPAACVLPADETHYIFAVEGEKAVKYRVQLGRTEGTSVQVFARRKAIATTGTWEPLTGTERIVVGNLGALTDGLAVQVKE